MKSFLILVMLLSAEPAQAGLPPRDDGDRILYLADSGIAVIQLSVLIDGQAPQQRLESFADFLLKEMDKDGDGVVTVEESRGKILTAREARQLQLTAEGNAIESSPDISPKDDKLSRAELLAYFKRIGLRPFSVRFQQRGRDISQDAALANSPGEPPLFDRLDVNRDKNLSVEELAGALEVLRKLDRDDDETISVAELQPLADASRAVSRPGMNNAAQPLPPFVSLASGESIPKLIRRIVDRYDSADSVRSGGPAAKNQKLSRSELGLPESEFAGYDVDGDGQLDFAELRSLVSSPHPMLSLVLDLGSGKVEPSGAEIGRVRMLDGTAHLQFGTAQISIVANSVPGTILPETILKPMFIAADVNSNGYLETSELPDGSPIGVSFSDLDTDKNNKVFLDEIVGAMKTRLAAAQSRIELTIIEQGRTLFDILDSDRDGRLAHREVRHVADKLKLWDSNGDGQLSEAEIPLQYRMVASQGSLPIRGIVRQNPAGMNANGPAEIRRAGPVWFRKMDRNGDGEISRREFLGELDLFDQLDLNRDGAIEVSEAMHAETLRSSSVD